MQTVVITLLKGIIVGTSSIIFNTINVNVIKFTECGQCSFVIQICANWFGFKDTESGITAIELSVGTTPLGVDIVNRSLISSHEHSACIDLEPFKKVLVHKGKYCFTVTAWNGGVNRLHVNGSSDCGKYPTS